MEPDLLWDEVCRVIKWHNHKGHSCVDTLNRLWAKHPSPDKPEHLPTISRSALEVTAEEWHLDLLWSLLHEKQRTPKAPATTENAVVVLRSHGVTYLMDGRRRINHWKREDQLGPHRVLVLTRKNEI